MHWLEEATIYEAVQSILDILQRHDLLTKLYAIDREQPDTAIHEELKLVTEATNGKES